MAKIGLSEGFSLIPKGTHVFKIIEVKYKEDFGKMEVVMQIASGLKHTERFYFLSSNGEPNQGGLNAFSYFAKAAMNDFAMTELENEQDLVGHYIRCEVDHEEVESNKTPGAIFKFVRLISKEPADGFDDVSATTKQQSKSAATQTAEEPVKQSAKKFDLNNILG